MPTNIEGSIEATPWVNVLNRFNGGTVTALDEARIRPNQAAATLNMEQVQDGIWATRRGTTYYGQGMGSEGSIIGAKEFIKSDGSRELLGIGGTTGAFYKSTDGSTWSVVSGATFNTTKKPFYLQINNYLYLTNGTDNLTRYDGSVLTQYTQLAVVTGFGGVRGAGLAAGTFNVYYQVTALNTIGETTGSTEVVVSVNKERDGWVAASNEKVTLTWAAVAGATRYQVYYSNEATKETLLATTESLTYVDDNSDQLNPFVFVPNDNTTGAPKFSQMGLSGNRIWATRDPNNRWRVYFSGVGQYIGYFSSFYGGGWVDLEKGGRETPQFVGHYRTGKGDSAATVVCSTPEGIGAIWQISLEAVTVGSSTFTVPLPIKTIGTIGADSPYAVVMVGDSMIFPNKRGIFSLGNKAQIANVLATDELSFNIRPSYRSLNLAKIDEFCGYAFDGKVFFSATNGGGKNDIIFLYDSERRNWTWYWNIGVKQFLEYTDSSGVTHFLGIPTTGNKLWEFTEGVSTDLGQKFNTSYISGLIPVSDNKKVFAKVKEALLELGRPKGTVKFEVIGLETSKGFTTLASRTITDSVSTIDFTNGGFSEYMFGEDDDVPVSFAQASVKKSLRIRKKINAIQYHVSSETADTSYTILSIQADGTITPTRTPSAWRQ